MGVNRSTALLLIAIGLVGFGVYRALYLPGMFVDPQAPLLLVGFLLQAAFGIAAGVGTWRRARWAPLTIGLLCVSIVATALIEVIIGMIAYLRALLDAVVAIVVTTLLVRYVRDQDGESRIGDHR
jgi:peptidoglycan/LPS O-acetylase OafA/YrhL